MKHPVDIDNWNRRENYLFFRDFANPYYSVTSQVDVTEAYIRAKALGIKFSHRCTLRYGLSIPLRH